MVSSLGHMVHGFEIAGTWFRLSGTGVQRTGTKQFPITQFNSKRQYYSAQNFSRQLKSD